VASDTARPSVVARGVTSWSGDCCATSIDDVAEQPGLRTRPPPVVVQQARWPGARRASGSARQMLQGVLVAGQRLADCYHRIPLAALRKV
jgi:hypothetical protein